MTARWSNMLASCLADMVVLGEPKLNRALLGCCTPLKMAHPKPRCKQMARIEMMAIKFNELLDTCSKFTWERFPWVMAESKYVMFSPRQKITRQALVGGG